MPAEASAWGGRQANGRPCWKRTPIVTAVNIDTTKEMYRVARAQVDMPSARTTKGLLPRPETASALVGIRVREFDYAFPELN